MRRTLLGIFYCPEVVVLFVTLTRLGTHFLYTIDTVQYRIHTIHTHTHLDSRLFRHRSELEERLHPLDGRKHNQQTTNSTGSSRPRILLRHSHTPWISVDPTSAITRDHRSSE